MTFACSTSIRLGCLIPLFPVRRTVLQVMDSLLQWKTSALPQELRQSYKHALGDHSVPWSWQLKTCLFVDPVAQFTFVARGPPGFLTAQLWFAIPKSWPAPSWWSHWWLYFVNFQIECQFGHSVGIPCSLSQPQLWGSYWHTRCRCSGNLRYWCSRCKSSPGTCYQWSR